MSKVSADRAKWAILVDDQGRPIDGVHVRVVKTEKEGPSKVAPEGRVVVDLEGALLGETEAKSLFSFFMKRNSGDFKSLGDMLAQLLDLEDEVILKVLRKYREKYHEETAKVFEGYVELGHVKVLPNEQGIGHVEVLPNE